MVGVGELPRLPRRRLGRNADAMRRPPSQSGLRSSQSVWLPSRWASRTGLPLWLLLRAAAGVASAWVLIHASAWSLERLAAARRPLLSGIVFARSRRGHRGGGWDLCRVDALQSHFRASLDRPRRAVARAHCCGLAHLLIGGGRGVESDTGVAGGRIGWDRESLRLVLCYGVFGFGYIIPATFLPAMARQTIHDPLVFGWSWPIFGAAALVSTLVAAALPPSLGNRRLWIGSQLLMAGGVALPVVWPGIAGIMLAALFVGGTFMVTTMVAIREAREVAGRECNRPHRGDDSRFRDRADRRPDQRELLGRP